ncbi:MAG: hypothetical protein M2R45_05350 [Verrucomicrobia subdivision 3 bacterium]|nr:hypothetical protein [Limisphaerales bacterium]MCS1416633.1 hypothetical protein [Limisphaerales bacterium]
MAHKIDKTPAILEIEFQIKGSLIVSTALDSPLGLFPSEARAAKTNLDTPEAAGRGAQAVGGREFLDVARPAPTNLIRPQDGWRDAGLKTSPGNELVHPFPQKLFLYSQVRACLLPYGLALRENDRLNDPLNGPVVQSFLGFLPVHAAHLRSFEIGNKA